MMTAEKSQITGVLLVAAAAVIWGWNGPMSKGLNMCVNVLTVIFLRSVIAVAIATPFFLLFDRSVFHVTFKQLIFLFFYGAFVVSGTTIGFFYSLQYLSVPSALLLHYTFPLLTIAGAFLVIRERPTHLQITAAVMILLGVGLGVMDSSNQAGQFSLPGILWGLLAVVGISMQTLCGRKAALKGFVSQQALLYHGFLWSIVSTALCKTAAIGWSDLPLITDSQWGTIITIAFLGSLLAHFLYLMGLRRITAPLGSLVSSLELVAAIFFGAVLLREIPTKLEVVGSIMVIIAIALASVPSKRYLKKTEKTESCSA